MQLTDAISNAFSNLAQLNEDLYDYWVNVLYTVDGNFVEEMWNEETLRKMEDDVMYNS
jgi:hypothetical protein